MHRKRAKLWIALLLGVAAVAVTGVALKRPVEEYLLIQQLESADEGRRLGAVRLSGGDAIAVGGAGDCQGVHREV